MRAFLILNLIVSSAAIAWTAKLHHDSQRLFEAARMLAKRSENDREEAVRMKEKIDLAVAGLAQTSNEADDATMAARRAAASVDGIEGSLFYLSALLEDKGITWTPPLSK
jgi:hypothetical protein